MPTAEQLEWFFKVAVSHGLGFLLLAGLVGIILWATIRFSWVVIGLVDDCRKKYLPELFGNHMEFIQTVKASSEASATASETTAHAVQRLTLTHSVSSENHAKTHANQAKTHKALACIAKAQQAATPEESNGHLEDAIRELK